MRRARVLYGILRSYENSRIQAAWKCVGAVVWRRKGVMLSATTWEWVSRK